jgi:hypothetical protein
MSEQEYISLKKAIIEAGFQEDIDWAEGIKLCEDPFEFWLEYTFVICNSGMKWQVATPIFQRIVAARCDHGKAAHTVFRHPGKCQAIDRAWNEKLDMLLGFIRAGDRLQYCQSLPWIGPITKYHLAKNLGEDCCKPDRHLVRIANQYETTPEEMCTALSKATGDRIATVDTVIWRAANLGMI